MMMKRILFFLMLKVLEFGGGFLGIVMIPYWLGKLNLLGFGVGSSTYTTGWMLELWLVGLVHILLLLCAIPTCYGLWRLFKANWDYAGRKINGRSK